MNNIVVTGLGEVLWDVLPEGKKIGGAPSNFAWHASQLGYESHVVSSVGRDALGDEIMDILKAKNLDGDISRVDFPTGTVQVELDGAGIPRYEIKEGVAWDNIPFTPHLQELASRTKAVCFGSLAQRYEVSRSTIRSFLESMPKDEDVLKIFDINLRQNFYNLDTIEDSMRRCNILKINDEELGIVSRMLELQEISVEDRCRSLLKRYGLKMLILTCGVAGSYVFSPESMSFAQTPKVDVVDTVGAGDSFTAAFVAAILKGKSISDAHKDAVNISAFVCTQNGAMPDLPTELK